MQIVLKMEDSIALIFTVMKTIQNFKNKNKPNKNNKIFKKKSKTHLSMMILIISNILQKLDK